MTSTMDVLPGVPTVALLRSDFIGELRANADLAGEMLLLLGRRVREADARLAHE